MEFNKDKHAYEVVDYTPTYISDRIFSVKKDIRDYYYKAVLDNKNRGLQKLPFTKPDHKKLLLAEVVNSKLAKYFGLNCPEYMIACTKQNLGVLSQDVRKDHSYTTTLYNYILEKGKYDYQSSLEELKMRSRAIKLKSVYYELDKTVLFHCATGQKDGHLANILVHNETDRNGEITGLTLIDNGLTYPVTARNEKELKKLYDNNFDVYVQTGIEKSGGCAVNLQNLYYGIRNSKYINGTSIENHLNIANNILSNNDFKKIENEIVEEYEYPSNYEYARKLSELISGQRYIMEKTTQSIEEYYNDRIV